MNTQTCQLAKHLREKEIRDNVTFKREEFMLEKARSIVMAEGLHALTLPRLAQVSEYSKPTIYKYFPCKEDLIVALAAQSAAVRSSYYEKAITFQGRPREKLMAIHSLNIGALVNYFSDMLNVHLNRLGGQASPEHQKSLLKYETKISEIHADIVREAVELKDLVLPQGVNEYQILMALTATSFGGHVMRESDSPVMKKWFQETGFIAKTFVQVVMDGFGWLPLSDQWDYSQTLERFYNEIFPEFREITFGTE